MRINFYCIRWLHGIYKLEGEIYDFFHVHNTIFSNKVTFSTPLLF